MIRIVLSERDFDYEIQALVSSFFAGETIQLLVEPDDFKPDEFLGAEWIQTKEEVCVGIHMDMKYIHVFVLTAQGQILKTEDISGNDDFHKHADLSAHPYRTEYKNKLKKLVYSALKSGMESSFFPSKIHVQIPAWGTMTGVRPAKIAMDELEKGYSEEVIQSHLENLYCARRDKAILAVNIAREESEALGNISTDRSYSLYVGIPFCPTTCLYCSFTSYPWEKFQSQAEDYLTSLQKELVESYACVADKALTSIYIGGGTPTALSVRQLKRLMDTIASIYPVSSAKEYTVEAGRPDSITQEKLEVLKAAGVTRISINPQTMQQRTLNLIGRYHTIEQTKEAFCMARNVGFSEINMDLIAGLPQETLDDFLDTLHQISAYQPECLTIHSLVVKRASRLRQILHEEGTRAPRRTEIMEAMMDAGQKFAQQGGYIPCYMYRQKNAGETIKGAFSQKGTSLPYTGGSGQENIGFAMPGHRCLYNILIMEEKETILACGAGASTKYLDPVSLRIQRVENVKSLTDYIQRTPEMIERKKKLFQQ